ncbi:hypothetical protein [Niabella beijingensis]|uniref:hypothetical protein n=1 Tax=Niabella beijingensis TaxID=2872700 RepID=UPI001CBB2FD6|nr:hypothetical protein [Niabella beijingensis]MBZ4189460.1 hypothetical protein [Niabella beijingensis]
MTRRTITSAVLTAIFCVLLSGFSRTAQAQCVNCGNSFLNVTDPNTIDYDNMVSLFHSTFSRQANGKVLIWGELTKSNGISNNLTPVELNSTNYPGLTGQILKFAGGSNSKNNAQFVVLTTDGLFAWGKQGYLLSTNLTYSASFQQITNGLPSGVSPADVKMLFGTYETLALLTCNGNVYVLSQNARMRGVGASSGGSSSSWYQVTQGTTGNPALGNVVALRGAPGALMALKSDGTVWTWGREAYAGDGNGSTSSYTRATQMTTPSGVTPKMIGATGTTSRTSYYILGTNGFVYSLGANSYRQLGDRSTTERTSWVRVKSGSGSNDYLSDVAWISPNEHDAYGGSGVNALTNSGTIWAWGSNDGRMLGFSVDGGNYNPTSNPGGLTSSDKIVAVETGGHTSMTVKKCSGRFGYVGHRVNGSMADGSTSDVYEPNYNFLQTAFLDICGASSGAATLFPVQGTVHVGDQIQLDYTPVGGTFTLVSGPATLTPQGLLSVQGRNADIKVKYEVSGECGTTSSEITINAADISLPVSLDKMSAVIRGNQLQVNFTTLTEQNNSHFEIEASRDGKTFVKVGAVDSKATNGNSAVPISYEFGISQSAATGLLGLSIAAFALGALLINRRNKWAFMLVLVLGTGIVGSSSCTKREDATIDTNGKLFIRIKQVDKDGTATYSKVIQAVQE